MKKLVSQIIVIIFILNCVCTTPYAVDSKYDRTRPVAVSARVGDMLDAEEKLQLNLFPNIENFKSARFFRIYDAGYKPGYVVEIEIEDIKLIATNRDPDGFKILRDYIDNYEEIIDDKNLFEEKWGIIAYDELGQPITKGELERTGKGSSYKCLFGLGCGAMGFWPMAISYGMSEEIDNSVVIPTFIVGMAICIGTGAYIGSRLDRSINNPLKTILESRKPKVVEEF
jgi:hypothetical protein